MPPTKSVQPRGAPLLHSEPVDRRETDVAPPGFYEQTRPTDICPDGGAYALRPTDRRASGGTRSARDSEASTEPGPIATTSSAWAAVGVGIVIGALLAVVVLVALMTAIRAG